MEKINSDDMMLSIVIPVYNEQDSLKLLYDEITAAVGDKFNFEIIFVDDGSSDGSVDVLKKIVADDSRVRVIVFRRNFGQTAAMSAGFDYARGNVIIPLDADRQNDPADIPMLIEKLNQGYDVVSGWRKNRKDKTLSRKIPSTIANWIIARTTDVRLHDYGCSLKAYRSEVIKPIKLYGEMHRFIPALANWSGAKITEVEVNHRPRVAGVAKYGLERTVKVVLDLLTVKFLGSYATKPIYVFGGLGILSGFASLISGIIVLYLKFISPEHLAMNRNPLLILSAILFMATIQFMLMGLLAEMIMRTYHESQNRSIYVIKDVLDFSAAKGH